jgi:hypothetical protein
MVYATGDIPVGDYDASRLSNIGIGHGAVDGGGGYTYFNPQTGQELSAVAYDIAGSSLCMIRPACSIVAKHHRVPSWVKTRRPRCEAHVGFR